jgi:hypothetical protein
MSNRQRLPRARTAVHCASCGRGIGKTARRADTVMGPVCARCTDGGALLRRLDCGHMATAGNSVAAAGGKYLCAACARDSMRRQS